MEVAYTLISVFTDREASSLGNISAVVELPHSLDAERMQTLAANLNQPATTFVWQQDGDWHLRWFAPDAEIGLCGHGSAAALAWAALKHGLSKMKFTAGTHTILGSASVMPTQFTLRLEAIPVTGVVLHNEALSAALGTEVLEHHSTGNKNIVRIKDERALRQMQPEWHLLRNMTPFGYAVTAPGDHCDFVSRTLVPKVQQLEDHATGSSHAALVPYWAKRIGKSRLNARQLSPRGGLFMCEFLEDVVQLTGAYEVLASGNCQI